MKRYKVLIILLTLLAVLISLPVTTFAAEKEELVISDDYKSFEYGGVKYCRVSYKSDDVEFYSSDYLSFTPRYTEEQQAEIEEVALYGCDQYIRLSIDFTDGGSLYEYYVREDLLDTYNEIASLSTPMLSFYKDSTRVYSEREKFFGEKVTMPAKEVMKLKRYSVESREDGIPFSKYSGKIIISPDNSFYYLDYAENGMVGKSYSEMDYESFVLNRITDPELCGILTDEAEPEKTMGLIYSSIALVAIVLGLLPIAFGVFCALKYKGAEQPYKALYTISISICAVLVIVLIILAFVVLPHI